MTCRVSSVLLGLTLLLAIVTLCSGLNWKKNVFTKTEKKLRGKGNIKRGKTRGKYQKKKGKGASKRGKGTSSGAGKKGKGGKSSKSDDDFESYLSVELTGSPIEITESEFRVLEHAFIELYNGLVDKSCPTVEDVTIEVDVDPGLVEESRHRTLQGGRTSGRFGYRVRGRCNGGCGSRSRLFNDAIRRREMSTSNVGEQETRRTRGYWNNKKQSSWLNQKFARTKKPHYKPFSTPQKYPMKQKNTGKGVARSRKSGTPHGKYGKTSGKSTKRSKTGKGKGGSSCVALFLSGFTESYNDLIQSLRASGKLVNVNSVESITELEEVECDAEVTPFETDVVVEHFGDPDTLTIAEIEALEEAFIDTYNNLNALNPELCDVFFRVIDEVDINILELTGRRLQGGRRRFSYTYQSRGRCRGCGRRSRAFDDANRRELWSSPFEGQSSWAMHNDKDSNLDSDTCFCPADVELRAPTEEEFEIAFNNYIKYLHEIGVISSIDSIEGVEEGEPDTREEDVNEEIPVGGSFVTVGSATADALCGAGGALGGIDVCLLSDLSGSFDDDVGNLRLAAEAIFEQVTAATTAARFGVAGFIDYGWYPYQLFSSLNPDMDAWVNSINGLSAFGGGDGPESQYDAIVGTAQGLNYSATNTSDCGWSSDVTVSRVLVVTTDATFHTPASGSNYKNDFSSTVEALRNANSIRIIGLKAFGAGLELDDLANATGGTTQPLSSDGSDIAEAILSALNALPCVIVPVAVGCGELVVAFDPATETVPPGGSATFTETYSVPSTATSGTTYTCEVQFSANGLVVGSHGVTVTVP